MFQCRVCEKLCAFQCHSHNKNEKDEKKLWKKCATRKNKNKHTHTRWHMHHMRLSVMLFLPSYAAHFANYNNRNRKKGTHTQTETQIYWKWQLFMGLKWIFSLSPWNKRRSSITFQWQIITEKNNKYGDTLITILNHMLECFLFQINLKLCQHDSYYKRFLLKWLMSISKHN